MRRRNAAVQFAGDQILPFVNMSQWEQVVRVGFCLCMQIVACCWVPCFPVTYGLVTAKQISQQIVAAVQGSNQCKYTGILGNRKMQYKQLCRPLDYPSTTLVQRPLCSQSVILWAPDQELRSQLQVKPQREPEMQYLLVWMIALTVKMPQSGIKLTKTDSTVQGLGMAWQSLIHQQKTTSEVHNYDGYMHYCTEDLVATSLRTQKQAAQHRMITAMAMIGFPYIHSAQSENNARVVGNNEQFWQAFSIEMETMQRHYSGELRIL